MNLVCLSLSVMLFLAAGVSVLADDMCTKAEHVALCRSMVGGASDPVAATKAGLEKLIMETKRAMEASVKSGGKGPLEVCKETYGYAIGDLETGLEYLKSNDKGSLGGEMSSTMTYYTTCDDAIKESGTSEEATGILKVDSTLLHMASTCMYLASLNT